MLTRLKVCGFKNLVDIDISFGPFTCIAGANGTGKSNLFDAILFLSALADKPLLEAALLVRGEGKAADVRSLFHRAGSWQEAKMRFEAEMIVPSAGLDDLGQQAEAKITFLRYVVELAYRPSEGIVSSGGLRLTHEELVHINRSEALRHLPFESRPAWRNSAIVGKGRRGRAVGSAPFISTETSTETVKLHQDGGSSGRPRPFPAASLPRTVLSSVNAAESPTALLARREMQSWGLLHLEPSALRAPDPYAAPDHIAKNGAHVPATLARLARLKRGEAPTADAVALYARVANRLAELLEDVRSVEIDMDDRRELFSLVVKDSAGTTYEARSLSDGTLRFLALAVLEQDTESAGLLCFEEPENGFHPDRIPRMLALLRDLAVDPDAPVGQDNPFRQVIINTHSPSVVAHVPDDSLIVASSQLIRRAGRRVPTATFEWLSDTWRARFQPDVAPASRGVLSAYLNPVQGPDPTPATQRPPGVSPKPRALRRVRQVRERDDLQLLLPFSSR